MSVILVFLRFVSLFTDRMEFRSNKANSRIKYEKFENINENALVFENVCG